MADGLRLEQIVSTIQSINEIQKLDVDVDVEEEESPLLSKCYMDTDYHFGKLINRDSGEVTHIFIKIVPSRRFITHLDDIYRNEISFFTEIYPELNRFQKSKRVYVPFNNVPNYLGGQCVSNKEIVLMESLKAAGYRFKCTPYDPDFIRRVLMVYGKFHALTFVYKHYHSNKFYELTKKLVNIWGRALEDGLTECLELTYTNAIEIFENSNKDIADKLKKFNGRQLITDYVYGKCQYACLNQGIGCTPSIVYKEESERADDLSIKLINFQLAYVSTPIHDLSIFFYSGASKEDMNKLDTYLDVYYQSFASFTRELGGNPTEIYPYHIFKQEWKKHSMLGLIVGMSMWVKKLMNRSDIENLIDKNYLPKEKLIELWKDNVTKVHGSAAFRERARNICIHAAEYGIL